MTKKFMVRYDKMKDVDNYKATTKEKNHDKQDENDSKDNVNKFNDERVMTPCPRCTQFLRDEDKMTLHVRLQRSPHEINADRSRELPSKSNVGDHEARRVLVLQHVPAIYKDIAIQITAVGTSKNTNTVD